MLAFDLEGGRAAGGAFIDASDDPRARRHRSGSIHTIVVHPPSTTHRQLDDAALAAAGITPGLLRVLGGPRGPRRPRRRFRSTLSTRLAAVDLARLSTPSPRALRAPAEPTRRLIREDRAIASPAATSGRRRPGRPSPTSSRGSAGPSGACSPRSTSRSSRSSPVPAGRRRDDDPAAARASPSGRRATTPSDGRHPRALRPGLRGRDRRRRWSGSRSSTSSVDVVQRSG